MNILSNVICVLSSIASIVFAVLFLIALGKEQEKRLRIYLIIAFVCTILAIKFCTSELYIYCRFLYGFTGLFTILATPFLFTKTLKFYISSKEVRVAIVLIAIVFFFIGLFCFGLKFEWSSGKDKYDDVFDKDPNSWSSDEKEYVNDFFKWQHEHYSDN